MSTTNPSPWRKMMRDNMPKPGVLFLARRYLYQEETRIPNKCEDALYFVAEVTTGKDGFGKRVITGFRVHPVAGIAGFMLGAVTPGPVLPLTLINAWMPIPGVATPRDAVATRDWTAADAGGDFAADVVVDVEDVAVEDVAEDNDEDGRPR